MNWILIREILTPELIVLVGILLTLLMSLHPEGKKSVPQVTSIILGLAAFYTLYKLLPATASRFLAGSAGVQVPSIKILYDSFISDTLSVYFRAIIYTVTWIISLTSGRYLKPVESPAEYYPILLSATLGAAMLTGANDFLLFFVALETLGLSSILLASYARLSQKSNEAGIKYLLSSATATGMLLLAISFIYGLTGVTNFTEVHMRLAALGEGLSPGLAALIAVLIVASISFKLAAAPFQNWSPDVYTGAPTNTTAFLSVVSKAGALAIAIRLFGYILSINALTDITSILLAVVAVLSIIIGNYVGVIQMISRGSVKRLLAYSSIAQAGYLLIGLAVLDPASIKALVLYFGIYAIMNTGAFMAAINIESETNSDNIYDLSGLITKRPITALAFSLCLLNLAGLPFIPAAFIAKFFLFATAYSSAFLLGKTLAVVGLLGSVIALFYYSYLAKIMLVDAPSNSVKSLSEGEICCCPTKIIKGFFNKEACAPETVATKWAHFSIMICVIALVYFGIFNIADLNGLVILVIDGVGL